jgi:hypothetical protein
VKEYHAVRMVKGNAEERAVKMMTGRVGELKKRQ